MTSGETEETCGGQREVGKTGGSKGKRKPPASFTTLSTIAIQAGQSLIVVSVLKSGFLVHLQLVQVHPGLCEIGSDQEENQKLIQDQQQLMEGLKKHEKEVLAAVEKNHQEDKRRRRRRRDEDSKQEEDEEVLKAMVTSLNEGWSLLLRLLQRRQEVLMLGANFYRQAVEFSVSLDKVEDLQTRCDRMTYDSMRKDGLGKSLQVLRSSNILLQRLRQLQRTEALHRTGGVLQEEEQEEEETSQSSQSSSGMVLRLEQLVEELQDRRRRLDQAIQLHLQQAENGIMVHRKEPESRETSSEDWTVTVDKILYQDLQSGSRSAEDTDLKSDTKTKETRDQHSGSRIDQGPVLRSRLDVNLDPRSEPARDVAPGSRSEETKNFESGSRLFMKPESTSDKTKDLQLDSRSDMQSGSRSDLQSGIRLDLLADSRSEETKVFDPRSRIDQTPVSSSNMNPESRLNVEPVSRSDETRPFESGPSLDLDPGSKPEATKTLQSEFRLNLMAGSRSDLKSESKSEETRVLEPESRVDQMLGLTSDVQPGSGLDVNLVSGSDETRISESGATLDLDPLARSDKTRILQPGSTSVENQDQHSSGPAVGLRSMLGKEAPCGRGHAHQTLPTNQRLQLLSSCQRLVDKMCSWLQQTRCVLCDGCGAGQQLHEAEATLNTLQQLSAQAESAGHDAETMKQILDQIRSGPSEPSRQLSPLKALTEQLKRTSAARLRPSAADPTGPPSPELAGQIDLVLKELQSLNQKIDSNLQLLHSYVTFLRTAQQVEEGMEELREIYMRTPVEEEEEEEAAACRSLKKKQKKKKQVDAFWQETLQRFLTCQELGDNYVHTVAAVSGAVLDLPVLMSAVQQKVERLSRTKQEVEELRGQQQLQTQQQWQNCRKYQERLNKTLQDLNCVSEMLDSCTLMDLGSDLQTSKLLDHFSQARPHFTQLDAEVDFMVRSCETLRGVQGRQEVEDLLKIQKKVKNQIHQCELILDLSSRFHLTSKQLEALVQAEPSPGSCGSREAEQIQSLFKTASALTNDICSAANHTGFRVDQLEARLLSLDSLCVSWLNEAARLEEKLRLLNDDIIQLRDSFKELKKRFSNLRFNYLKRNDRTRTMKAARNQLQQVDLYDEKLQTLQKRLQGLTARLGSEVKDRGVAKEAEGAINELQRQMEELERSVGEHRKTLEMSCRLQRAMEEYQFWFEDASATIARVGKFSSECRSTEAIAVLHRQFEKFVWPTVPQQEERISQIGELAVRLHGVEEGRRYMEKTVSKHSEMVEAIRELSHSLTELEAKLKQQDDEDKEKKVKENRKMEKEEKNKQSTQEAIMYELKETGHTPELYPEHDGKELKRQTANRKPLLQKSRSQDADRENESSQKLHSDTFTSSYCSSQTISHSCSPEEASQHVHSIPQAVIGPLFDDIQREFQRKEVVSVSCGSNVAPFQDASGGLSEEELQKQDVMTEDSFSNDEYDCVSPDDISLPPLAETPESNMVLSDVEEGFCFSSHSVHISQYSHQSEHSCTEAATGAATGAVQQQSESSPTLPTSRHSSTGFRAESSSFAQNPLTVRPPGLFTSTLCSILKPGKTSSTSVPHSTPEPSCPSPRANVVHKSNTPDKDQDVPEKRSPSHSDPLLKDLTSQSNQPQTSTGASKGKTSPLVAELHSSTSLPQAHHGPQPFNGEDPDLYKGKTPSQGIRFPKSSTKFPQSCTETSLHQDINYSQSRKETSPVSKPQRSSAVTQQTVHFQSSLNAPQESPLSQGETFLQTDPVPQFRGFAQSPGLTEPLQHKHTARDSGLLKTETTTTLPRDSKVSQSYQGSRSGLDQDVPSFQTSKESQSSSPTTTVKQTVYCHSSPPNSHSRLTQGRSVRSQQEKLLPQDRTGPPEVQASSPPEPNNINSVSVSSSNTFSSNQTVHSLYESLTSTCTQQCVHDPGMTTGSPAKPSAPVPQTQALAQPANLHVSPLSSPLHLLTPDQDPNICQPTAICEGIRLTPQIQGPPCSAPPVPPPPQAQAESIPQGKASKPGPACFTRPLSRATIMEGSPVTLEVEVTGHPEPTLTWCKAGEMSARAPLSCQDGKHFLFIPEVVDSEAQGAERRDGGDNKWLVGEVFDIISLDWLAWFGTLCVLLWLIYLILL